MEEKWREPVVAEKKPKDLLRAIGKIETSDWNIKEIEKKINENKMGKSVNKDKEKVPKWSREQFLARQTKMEKQHLDRQDSAEGIFLCFTIKTVFYPYFLNNFPIIITITIAKYIISS